VANSKPAVSANSDLSIKKENKKIFRAEQLKSLRASQKWGKDYKRLPTAMNVLTKAYPTIPLSGHSELMRLHPKVWQLAEVQMNIKSLFIS